MNGNELVVDTNIFINLGTQHLGIDKILQGKRIYLSIISEIEILGFHKISESDALFFASLLSQCNIIDLSQTIKLKSIEIKRKYKLITPDAVIAATAIILDKPLFTFDKDFSKITELTLFVQ